MTKRSNGWHFAPLHLLPVGCSGNFGHFGHFGRLIVVGRSIVAAALLYGCASATPPAILNPGEATVASGPSPIASPDIRGPVEPNADVVNVVDGDTIDVRFRIPVGDALAGEVEAIRLIGIDTPESKRPNTPVECFAKESGLALRSLLPLETAVRIELDVELRDRYGRLLGYVLRSSDGLFVNHEMARAGMAAALTFPPNVQYSEEFRAAAEGAQANNVGLWSMCASNHEPATANS